MVRDALLARALRTLGRRGTETTAPDARGTGASQGDAWSAAAVRSRVQACLLSLLLQVLPVLLPILLHRRG